MKRETLKLPEKVSAENDLKSYVANKVASDSRYYKRTGRQPRAMQLAFAKSLTRSKR